MNPTYQKATAYSLSSVKVAKFASHETLCFQAKIERDGVVVGSVENGGTGGCHFIDFVSAEEREAFKAAAATLPPYDFSSWGGSTDTPRDSEGLVDWLLAEYEAKKHAKKYATFFQAKADGTVDPTDGYSFLKFGRKKAAKDDPRLVAWLSNQPNDVVVVEA